jgi:hypothetical protein
VAESRRKGKEDWLGTKAMCSTRCSKECWEMGARRRRNTPPCTINIITYNKVPPSARSGAVRLTAREVAEPSGWQPRPVMENVSHLSIASPSYVSRDLVCHQQNTTIDGIALRNLLCLGETPHIHLSVHRHNAQVSPREYYGHQILRGSQLALSLENLPQDATDTDPARCDCSPSGC